MSIIKRVDEARKAYRAGDLDAAAHAHSHDRIRHAAREEHGGASHQYLGDMVYGGLDGIVTTFAVVTGVAGAALGSNVILILGLANLFADGFSMATGAYLSSKSEQEYYDRERQRESWEFEQFPEAERQELYEIYRARGYTEEDAGQLVAIQTRDREKAVRTMMVDELGLLANDTRPHLSALATFIAFVAAGSVPLIIYLLRLAFPGLVAPDTAFMISLVLSAAALFGLGAAKVLVTELNVWRSGLEMLLVGGAAAVVAYTVGALLKGIGG